MEVLIVICLTAFQCPVVHRQVGRRMESFGDEEADCKYWHRCGVSGEDRSRNLDAAAKK